MSADTKKTASKIILKITFLPYIAILLQGIYGAIFGFEFWNEMTYGIQGALEMMIFCFFVLVAVGAIPASAVIQLTILIRRKTRTLFPEKSRLITAVSFVILAIIAVVISVTVAGVVF